MKNTPKKSNSPVQVVTTTDTDANSCIKFCIEKKATKGLQRRHYQSIPVLYL